MLEKTENRELKNKPHAKAQRCQRFFIILIKILCGLAALREQQIKIDRIP